MITRRTFLTGTALAASEKEFAADPVWDGPVLDIHLHPRREGAMELDHLQGSGVSKAVLLAGMAAEDRAKELVTRHPDRFLRFTSTDVREENAVARLHKSLQGGAIGLGELKLPVEIDGPEMKRVYALAGEFQVPVLLHFEEGNFNSGIRRLPQVLQAFPRTTFIGHGQSWWAHISADVVNEAGYPSGKVKPGGLTDRVLADYANIYGDFSANSGRNALTRDEDFAAAFLVRHRRKLMFGSDCPCRDGRGDGQSSSVLQGKCIARETLTALQRLAAPDLFRTIVWENGTKLLKISA
jgi:predicted TIM-barrel fold metal-dependent hydrolase